MKISPTVLFLGKKNNFYCECAKEFVELHFPINTIVLGSRGDALREDVRRWEGDYIISFLAPWIIPHNILSRARKACINFHPGPPEYPGIGCTNFAVYNEESSYGVVCHYMNASVDTGKLIAVRRFPVLENDTVYSLTQRCCAHLLVLFYDIMSLVLDGRPLLETDETWTRKPFRRAELNELCRVTPEMPEREVLRRVRATTFPNAPGAYIQIGDMLFKHG